MTLLECPKPAGIPENSLNLNYRLGVLGYDIPDGAEKLSVCLLGYPELERNHMTKQKKAEMKEKDFRLIGSAGDVAG